MARRTLLLLATLFTLVGSACSSGPPDHRVLFIGNSFTHGNNMPEMVEKIADANGVSLDWEMIAPGGAYLSEHATNQEVRDAIFSGEYDVIVFQEQSVITSVPSMVQEQVLPAARDLDDMADTVGAKVVWFQTWGHLNGFAEVGHSGYSSMQDQIVATYDQLALETGGTVARAGERWERTQASGPPTTLYASDGYHPSPAGSYVAAIAIAEAILTPAVVEAPSVSGVDAELANFLLAA